MKQKKIRKQLAKKYNRDVRVIEAITKHPFKFLTDIMEDKDDMNPVRVMYLGVFAQKNRMNKRRYYSETLAKKILQN